ncbi:MAG: hypothetical protein R2822_06780 [Spirosomataceae bacterium]
MLFIFSILWVVGCHPTLRHKAFEWGLTADSYRYGDLYHLANLPQFKKRVETCQKKYTNAPHRSNHALYIIGDSFSEKERINANDFDVSSYLRIHWNDSLTIHLDTTKKNILLLETVERHFREHFSVPVRQLTVSSRPSAIGHRLSATSVQQAKTWTEILKESEESLTYFLFSSDFFLFFKELKASLNLRWFGRHSDQVAITPDGKNILYCWDTDSSRITSCFKYLPDKEVDDLVTSVNKARDFYLTQGFDEVYLAIIPNKTSIVAPEMGLYNHLVERVQQHPHLQTPFVDIWTSYRQHPQAMYSLSDTHWNCTGQAIWLDEVNKVLK